MKARDRELGMNAAITRRDFLDGMGVAIGASLLPGTARAADIGAQDLPGYYPPALTGLRGSHPGSFEVAHALRDGASFTGEATGESYDLVVVGGGISGLSAAYFYREAAGGNAKILVLDNHDDFGGHAKRNEFSIDGRLIIGYGGTMLMEAPSGYPPVAKRLIRELGIDIKRFYEAYDHDLYSSLGLSRGTFFDRSVFGTDHLAIGSLGDPKILEGVPLSPAGKRDLARLYANERHYLGDITPEAMADYLAHTDYRTYLKKAAGIGDEALQAIESLPHGVWNIGIDALPARTAWASDYPGFGDLDLDIYDDSGWVDEPRIFHFPDGNATIARLLVRALIPRSAPGNDMEDIVTARFDYGRLDEPRSPVRIRLNSTAVRVRHIGDGLGNPLEVTYVRGGRAKTVTGGQVVMACYHAVVPLLCPEIPESQRKLLASSLRSPLVYTNALIRNWRSFVNLGLLRARCAGSFHYRATLDFPVSLGDYACPKDPDHPILVHMIRAPLQPGQSAREQFYAGKRELLTMPFETFERNTRDQLNRMLGDGGFDAARDIAALTVNRWPHGYAYGYDEETDRVAFEPSQWPEDKRHWKTASQRFGNISIAATDAASNAMSEAAIEEAYRAVSELSPRE
ncbi:MAG: NAD(P)/FAD-dependent oxidoreductase [Gammaproteobacteria bacterium]|nr:NAD(P)/FAD-dependent oxidoreductase [Gammaproteobacteria bacterium]